MSEIEYTPPLGLSQGDRVALENRMNAHEAKIGAFVIEAMKDQVNFHEKEIKPATRNASRAVILGVVAVALSVASLAVQLARVFGMMAAGHT